MNDLTELLDKMQKAYDSRDGETAVSFSSYRYNMEIS